MILLKKFVNKILPKRAREAYTYYKYCRKWVSPRPTSDAEYFIPQRMIGHAGYDMQTSEQLQRLTLWRNNDYQSLFRAIRNDSLINVPFARGDYRNKPALHNSQFASPDAEVYAAMIQDIKPKRIVEVGSGYSTLIARKAIEHGKLDTKLVAIDPQPRTEVAHVVDEIIRSFVEDTDISTFDWPTPSILFIDSSHVCRARGDIPKLFCELVPKLPPGVVVHVHDIFLPYEYPTNIDSLLWTEQYTLAALLSGSPKYKVAFTSHFMSRQHPQEMQAAFGPLVGQDPLLFGGSFWFSVQA